MTTLTAALVTNASAIFAMIVEVALKGTILMAAAAALTFALRNAAASLRHLVWGFSLLALLAIPAMSVVLPRWEMQILQAPVVNAPVPVVHTLQPATRIPSPAAVAPSPAPRASLPPATTFDSPHPSLSLLSALALLWLGGVAAGLITIVGGMLTLRRFARRSLPSAEHDWDNLLARLKTEIGITRNVRLLISPSAAMPATWGVLRPTVLLPVDAEEWDAERQRVVLLHELAHIKRNDCLMQIVAQLSCAIYWFHPGVWYVAARIRSERELACDEYVVDVGVNACDYATHLLDIATGFRSPSGSSIAGIAMARPSQLEGRLNAILSENFSTRWRASRAMRAATMVLLAGLTVPLAAMRPWRSAIASSEVVASFSSSETPIAASDTFHWKGRVPEGKWVEVFVRYGDIRVELSRDNDVEVFAVKRSGDTRNATVALDRSNGMRFCVINTAASESAEPCRTGMRGNLESGRADVRVDFTVRVPAKIGASVHTGRGNITAESVRSYVWGTSEQGDIRITTTDLAEASTSVGSIFAQFGRSSWTGPRVPDR